MTALGATRGGPRPLPLLWIGVAGAALVVVVDALGLPIGPARVAAGLFLVAWAPGAALLGAVRPRFLAPSARAVLAVPISLAVAAVLGVVLDRTAAGVEPGPMAVASLAVTTALLVVGEWRRREPPRRATRVTRDRAPVPGSAPTAASAHVPASADDATEAVAVWAAAAPDPGSVWAAPAPDSTEAWSPPPAPAAIRELPVADEAPEAVERPARAPARHTGRRLRGLPAAAIAHLRDPLFLNAYALGLSGVLTSGLGVVYWAVAARLYPADVVGVNAALLSLVTLLANVSQLNLRSGFGRFVPIAGARVRGLVHAGYAAAVGLALVTGLGVIVVLAVAPALLAQVQLTPTLAWLFPVTVVLWTVFTVQDHVLIAFRRTAIVPVENGVFALAKILLLIPLAGAATTYGILVSWTVPTALGVVIVTGWILWRLVPGAQLRADLTATAEGWGRGSAPDLAPGSEPMRSEPQVSAGGIVRYVAGDYVGSLLAIGSSSILPVLVLGVLGAASSAHFYMVGMIAAATQLVPTVLATSLLVEVSSGRATFEEDGVRVARQLALLLGPIALGLAIFADPVLRIFGAPYAAEGATALRLLALAGIPYAVINLAFIRLRLEQRVRWVVIAQAVLAVLLVGPVVVVLPAWGITGVGWVTLVSQTLVAVVLAWSELRGVLPAAARVRLPRRP